MRRLPLIAFLTAHVISAAGSTLTIVALPWLVLSTTGSATRTGLVAFAEMGAYVLASALGAPVVDRLGHFRVAVTAAVASAATVAAIPALGDRKLLGLGTLVALVIAVGAAQGLAANAQRVLLPEIIERSGASLDRSVSLFDGADRLATMLGAPLAGVLVAVLGAAHVLWVDAATFAAAAALLLLFVRGTTRPEADGEREPYLSAMRGGLRFLRRERVILAIGVMVMITNLASQAFTVIFVPVWIRDVVGDPAALGVIAGVSGAGALIGNALFTWLSPRLPRRWTFAVCFLIAGSPRYFAMAIADELTAVLVVCFVSGLATAALNPIIAAVGYERIPKAMRGRVLGLLTGVAWLGIPFGALFGGLAVSAFGRTGGLWAAGGVYLAATLLPFVQRVWRDMDRPVAAAEEPVAARRAG